jgi:hypothetical protein
MVTEKIMISSISGSGQLVAVDVKDALNEFTQLYKEISDYLIRPKKKPNDWIH